MQYDLETLLAALSKLSDVDVDAVYKAIVEEGRKRKRPFAVRRAITIR